MSRRHNGRVHNGKCSETQVANCISASHVSQFIPIRGNNRDSCRGLNQWNKKQEQDLGKKKSACHLWISLVGYLFFNIWRPWRRVLRLLNLFRLFSVEIVNAPNSPPIWLATHYFPMLYNLWLHTPRFDPCLILVPDVITSFSYPCSTHWLSLNQRGSQPNIWHRWTPRTTSFQSDVGGG